MQNGDGWIAVQDAFVLGVRAVHRHGPAAGPAVRCARSSGTVAAIPPSNGLSRRRWAIWAARIMILDGTQPTLTQVPPMVPRSISVTVRALLDGLQCCRHRGPAAANDGDMQTGALKCITAFWFTFAITSPDRASNNPMRFDGGQQLVAAHGGGQCDDLRAAFWIRTPQRHCTPGIFSKAILDVGRAGCRRSCHSR